MAVSQSSDPTGAYYRYAFSYTDFPSYPVMAVWSDGYYAAFDMFYQESSFVGDKACAFDRSSMLAGSAATQQCFMTPSSIGGLLPADLDGNTVPPLGSPNYLLALGTSPNQLAFYAFHVDWATPANSTFTGPTNLTTTAFTEACSGGTCIPQLGTTQKLDSDADRLQMRLAYRNFGEHESLVTTHAIKVGTSSGVHWYELRSPATVPVIFQEGTIAPDTSYRWIGSAAMDRNGDIAVGYSVSSSTLNPRSATLGVSPRMRRA